MSIRVGLRSMGRALGVVAVVPPPVYPMEYTFSEGTASLYDVMYDTIDDVGPIVAAQSQHVNVNIYPAQRKLARTSDGTLYLAYWKQLAGKYQIYVIKSEDDGATWTDDTRISTRADMASYHQYTPAIAVDSEDHLHVVWQGQTTGYPTALQIWYALFDTEWRTPVRISDYANMGGGSQQVPAIAVDSEDHLHVVWWGTATGYTRAVVWYNVYDGSSWVGPIVISTAPTLGFTVMNPSIAVDSEDHLHVVWGGTGTGYSRYQIWYNVYDGSSWAGPVRISTHANMSSTHQFYPVIAVDSQDHLHVVWVGAATGYPTYRQVWYAEYDGDNWITPVRISDAVNMSSYHQDLPSIAVDPDDVIHVLWHGKATGYTDQDKIWYNTYTDSWAGAVVRHPTGQNRIPSLRWSRWPP